MESSARAASRSTLPPLLGLNGIVSKSGVAEYLAAALQMVLTLAMAGQRVCVLRYAPALSDGPTGTNSGEANGMKSHGA